MIELDESEGTLSSNYEDITKELKDLKERKANSSRVHVNYSLDSMIILNVLRRLQALKEGKPADAVRIARENYDKKSQHKRRKKFDCNAGICIIYPCDERNGYADTIQCTNGCTLHLRCEGAIVLDGEKLPSLYECKKCIGFGPNAVWLQESLQNAKLLLADNIHNINTELRKITMKIEKLEEDELKCGPRLGKLREACKTLKLDKAKYHGGDFEGRAVQQMLDTARNGPKNEPPNFELIQCIKDKPALYDKFRRVLTTLREVSDTFRMPIEYFDDDSIAFVKDICEQWGRHWLRDFPHINLTPKAHDMIWVLPEVLKRRRTFHMFYKMEERGEAIHAELNQIQ